MSHHHHGHEPSQIDLFEGDQSKLFSGVLSHHHGGVESAESKKQVKRIWMITLYLSIITVFEVGVGLIAYNQGFHNYWLIAYFLILTLVKAYFIVKVFMHLGDELNNFVWLIIGPLFLFVWIIIAFLMDGAHGLLMNSTFANNIKDFLP